MDRTYNWKDPLVNSNQLFWNWQKSLLRKTTTNRYFFAIIKRVRNSAQILHNVAKKIIKLHYNIHTLESNEKISIFAKGQWISEWIYEVIVSPKIWTKYCKDFCPVVWHSTGQKSLQYLVHILGETITSKFHSEIYQSLFRRRSLHLLV